MYKIPMLERAKETSQMAHCEDCRHLNPAGSEEHCYMFREIIVPCVLYRDIFSDMNANNRFALLRATFAVGCAEGNKPTDTIEAIAVKALEDLDKHYNTVLRDAPWPTAAFHIVKTALSKKEGLHYDTSN